VLLLCVPICIFLLNFSAHAALKISFCLNNGKRVAYIFRQWWKQYSCEEEIGKLIAERALKAGVTQVAFDRSGFRYHGRVKALAEAAE
jgi:hypothetical protein